MAREDHKGRSLAPVRPVASGVRIKVQGMELGGTHLEEAGGEHH